MSKICQCFNKRTSYVINLMKKSCLLNNITRSFEPTWNFHHISRIRVRKIKTSSKVPPWDKSKLQRNCLTVFKTAATRESVSVLLMSRRGNCNFETKEAFSQTKWLFSCLISDYESFTFSAGNTWMMAALRGHGYITFRVLQENAIYFQIKPSNKKHFTTTASVCV